MRILTLNKNDVYRGNLVLVNRESPVREKMDSDIMVSASIGRTSVRLQQPMEKLLTELMDKINARGKIISVSGWRSRAEQEELYRTSMSDHGEEYTRKYVAYPGCSEHETGLAVDLALKQDNIDLICPEFPNDGICREFCKECAKYGFILRYPEEKEGITQIGYEPWHFRFVGIPHSIIMSEKGMVLEEYVDFLRTYPASGEHYKHFENEYMIEVYFLKSDSDRQEISISADNPYSISGNNMDGFIITEWKRYEAG